MTTIQMHNGNNLVVPSSNKIQLGNGLTVAEQRGKKDMMWGKCVEGNFKDQVILYPIYAADKISGRFTSDEALEYHIVKDEDIVMSAKEN